jgi:hypothetical protein
VIRHPAPPVHRGAKREGHCLRLRLPPGLADEARAVSLSLSQANPRAERSRTTRRGRSRTPSSRP